MERVGRYKHTQKKTANSNLPTNREIRRVMRLLGCIVILIMAISVKTLFPDTVQGIRVKALNILGGNVDYKEALTVMGEAVAGEKAFGEAIGEAYDYAFTIAGEADNAIEASVTEEKTEIKEETEPVEEKTQDADVPMIRNLTYIHSGEDAPPEGASYAMVQLGFEYCMPVSGTLTSPFGYRVHPVDGGIKFHYGTDFGAEEGTEILAFGDGIVSAVGESSILGLYVIVDHGDGVRTTYGHCREIYVSDGDAVEMGEKIAEMGRTGNATGNCLHFEIEANGVNIDPEYYLTWV